MTSKFISATIVVLALLLVAMTTAHATPKWTKTISNLEANNIPTGIISFGDTLVVVANSAIFGLDAATGDIKYGPRHTDTNFDATNAFVRTNCNGDELLILVSANFQARQNGYVVMAIDPPTGTKKWSYFTMSPPVAVGAHSCVVTFQNEDRFPLELVVLNATTGYQVATTNVMGDGGTVVAVMPDVNTYVSASVANQYNNISAVNVLNGAPVWSSHFQSSSLHFAFDTASNAIIVTADDVGGHTDSRVGFIGSLDANSGKTNWKFPLSGFVVHTPAVVNTATNTVCAGGVTSSYNQSYSIVCVDRTTGEFVSKTNSRPGSVIALTTSTKGGTVFASIDASVGANDADVQVVATSALGVRLVASLKETTYTYQERNIAFLHAANLVAVAMFNSDKSSIEVRAFAAN